MEKIVSIEFEDVAVKISLLRYVKSLRINSNETKAFRDVFRFFLTQDEAEFFQKYS